MVTYLSIKLLLLDSGVNYVRYKVQIGINKVVIYFIRGESIEIIDPVDVSVKEQQEGVNKINKISDYSKDIDLVVLSTELRTHIVVEVNYKDGWSKRDLDNLEIHFIKINLAYYGSVVTFDNLDLRILQNHGKILQEEIYLIFWFCTFFKRFTESNDKIRLDFALRIIRLTNIKWFKWLTFRV